MAREIFPTLRDAGVGLVINDHADVAQEVGADLCHLGQEDFAEAKTPTTPFGLSTHSPDQALRAVEAGPAYIAVGPVYATATKPGARPVTLDYVRWAAGNVKVPWFAIGGINLDNLEEVVLAGAQRICAVSAILNAPDIAEACRTISGGGFPASMPYAISQGKFEQTVGRGVRRAVNSCRED